LASIVLFLLIFIPAVFAMVYKRSTRPVASMVESPPLLESELESGEQAHAESSLTYADES
jgi:hypothetical protein